MRANAAGLFPAPQGSSETGPNSDISSLFASATEHYRRGAIAQANDLGKAILARDPNHAQTLNLLGIIAQQAGRNRAAVKLIAQAIAQDPGRCRFPLQYRSRLCRRSATPDEALAHYGRAISSGLKDETALVNDNAFVTRCIQPHRGGLAAPADAAGIVRRRRHRSVRRGQLAVPVPFAIRICPRSRSGAISDRTSLCGFARSGTAELQAHVRFDDDVAEFSVRAGAAMLSATDMFSHSAAAKWKACACCTTQFAEKLNRGADVDPLVLIAIAAYAPLYLLPTADAIAAHSWPEFLHAADRPAARRAAREKRNSKDNTIAYTRSTTMSRGRSSSNMRRALIRPGRAVWPVEATTLDALSRRKIASQLWRISPACR